MAVSARTAVVLFNLGGPDALPAVQPFLFNLFNDKAIIGLPWPLRTLIARLIARRRAPIARHIYAQIGGGSPLLAYTRQQADALETAATGTASRRARLRLHALLASDERRRGAPGEGIRARSDRSAATLPAVLDDDHGVLAGRLAGRRARGRAGRAGARRLLLSEQPRLHRSRRPASAADAGDEPADRSLTGCCSRRTACRSG